MSKVPERWATRLIERGYTDRRSTKTSVASASALAEAMEVNTSTVTDAMTGRREPTVETVALLTRFLGSDVAEWLGYTHHGDWDPPAEAALLTPRQRKALEDLIRSITDRRAEGGGVRDIRTAPRKTAAPGPRQQPGKTVEPRERAVASGDEVNEAQADQASTDAAEAARRQREAQAEMRRKAEAKKREKPQPPQE